MELKGTHNGHEIRGHVYNDGSVGWKTDAIKDTDAKYEWDLEEFQSPKEIMDALDKYDLMCRKSFTNKAAYIVVMHGWNAGRNTKWEKVDVTSLSPDGNEAWIKTLDGRRKVRIETLYATEESVKAYTSAYDAVVAAYEKDKEDLQAALDKCRWVPKHE